MSRPEDITGRKFGKLTVIGEYVPGDGRTFLATWLCECDCGNEKRVASSSLRSGNTKSCGCIKPTVRTDKQAHGMSGTPEYASWCSMRSRCENPNAVEYHRYGGRGVSVCDEWRLFVAFYEDMGVRPEGHSLDRIDTNGNYGPDNCRWATATQQTRNRRGMVLNEASVSVIKTMLNYGYYQRQIAMAFGVSRSTVANIHHGKSWVDVAPLQV